MIPIPADPTMGYLVLLVLIFSGLTVASYLCERYERTHFDTEWFDPTEEES